MTSAAISAARPRLFRFPPPSSALSPWRTPPAVSSRALPVSSSYLGSSAGRLPLPRAATEPLPRLWRRSSCSGFQSSSGATMSAVELQPSLALKVRNRCRSAHPLSDSFHVRTKRLPEHFDDLYAKAVELAQTLKGTSIFLVGMSNTLKASLGKALADVLQYYYFDSDNLVEEAAGGESAARAFRESDESGFRDSETEVLKQLTSMGRLVVCAGDGAVQNATNLGYLRYGISIWVDVPLDIVADEVLKSGTQFPIVQDVSTSHSFDQVLTELARRYEKNREGYGNADATVSLLKLASKLGYDDLSTVTPEDLAIETLREIEKLIRVKKMMEDAARPF